MLHVNKYTLGVFLPSSYSISKDRLYNALDNGISKIEAIAYTQNNNKLISDYCDLRGLIKISFPLNKNFTLPWVVNQIVKMSEVVIAVDNGRTKSLKVIKEACLEHDKKLSILSVEPMESLAVELYQAMEKYRDVPVEVILKEKTFNIKVIE